MRPVRWQELKAIAEQEGFSFSRQRGDHYVMTKPGAARPVVIPCESALGELIVLNTAKNIGITNSEIRKRLGLGGGKGKGRRKSK